MFLYRVTVEELDGARLLALKDDLARSEIELRANCPIREMSVMTDRDRELDIYVALDDVIGAEQLKRLAAELNAMFEASPVKPRVSSELIHI
ncbi:MAG TPA: hypothetical protein VGB91_13850 [Rhizomicrobium sp.]